MKTLYLNSEKAKSISVCDAESYQTRFKKFICEKVLGTNKSNIQLQDEFIRQWKSDYNEKQQSDIEFEIFEN